MSTGFYLDRDTALHRLHPVSKIVLLILSFASAFILEHPLYALLLALVVVGLGARTGAIHNAGRIKWLLVMVAAASFLIWTILYPGGEIVARLGPLPVSRQGMLFGAGMGLRLDLMVFCGLVFLTVCPIEDFTYGLTRMGLPFPVSFALSLSFRLVPLFSDTVRTILDAQRARGLDPEAGGLAARLKSYIPLLAPVFSSAMRRTDQLAIALESKGFGLGRPRGNLREFRAGTPDLIALLLMSLILALAITARVLKIASI